MYYTVQVSQKLLFLPSCTLSAIMVEWTAIIMPEAGHNLKKILQFSGYMPQHSRVIFVFFLAFINNKILHFLVIYQNKMFSREIKTNVLRH